MDRRGGLVNRSLMELTAASGRTSYYSADNKMLVFMYGNKIIEMMIYQELIRVFVYFMVM